MGNSTSAFDKKKKKKGKDESASFNSIEQTASQQTKGAISRPQSSASESSNATNEPEHSPAPHPLNEAARQGYLCSLNILDTEPEKRFDDITRLCCMVFKTPIALVSLVDKERQWFKSVQGLTVTETDRKSSFCAWTLLPEFPEVLVVPNALEDVRFRNNPLVLGGPHIRFYAGAPLVATNQQRLGSLCIIDNKPREFDAESCNMLANMAEMVVREIEKDKMIEAQRQKSAELSKENTQLLRAIDCFKEGIMLCNLSLPRWPIVFTNEAWDKVTGIEREEGYGVNFWDIFQVPEGSSEKSRKSYASAIAEQQSFDVSVYYLQHGEKRWLHMQFRCAHSDAMDQFMPLVGIPALLSPTPSHDGPSYYFATVSDNASSRRSVDIHSTASNIMSTRNSTFTIINTKIDPFDDVKLGPLLGKGAYGRVYRGHWNGAQVAVKVMETLKSDDGSDVLEAVLGSQVSHPNITQTYKYCARDMGGALDADHEGREMVETWMIMEFCNKGSISDAVDRGWFRKRHSLFEVDYKSILATARELAAAMCYLHSRNILHGDLTGLNVLLAASEKDDRKFTAKVADFGLSRVLDQGPVNTKSFGTITHMPPELLMDGDLSFASDVYAFGIIFWEMFMGTRPYAGMAHGQILHAVTSGKQLSVGQSCPGVLKEFMQKCYNFKPEKRPTFPEILNELDELEQELC